MERFLEVILDVERQAASLKVDARARAAELEHRFREGLARIEVEALTAVRDELDQARVQGSAAIRDEAAAIEDAAERDVAALEAAALRVEAAALDLVSSVILPRDEAS